MDTSAPVPAPVAAPEPAQRHKPLWRRILSFENLLTFCFLIVSGVLVYHHDIWRDEAQAYLLARDSATIPELYQHLRYEGHPGLWHVILWFVTRVTVQVQVMQWLHWAMAGASVWLVAQFAPFTWIEKILFAFGYFTLFEYCVVARNYQIAMLLTIIFCVLWVKKRESFVWQAIVLGLLCHANVFGTIIAGALGIMVLCESAFSRTGWGTVRRHWVQFLCGIVILTGMAWAAVYFMLPARDLGYSAQWQINVNPIRPLETFPRALRASLEDTDHVDASLSTVWNGFVPVPQSNPGFWGSNFLDDSEKAAFWACVLLGAAVVLIARRPWVLTAFLIGTAGMLLFMHARFLGNTRHHGNYFVLLVACLWLVWARNVPLNRWWKRIPRIVGHLFFTALLAAHVVGAYTAVRWTWGRPFSVGHQAANFIRSEMRPGEPLVAQWQVSTATVAAYLPGEKFFMPTGKWGSFTIWDRRYMSMNDPEVAMMMARNRKRSVLFVGTFRMDGDPDMKLLKSFEGSVVDYENYYIYRVEPPPQRGESNHPPTGWTTTAVP